MEELISELQARFGICSTAYPFGSLLYGTADEHSDRDIVVILPYVLEKKESKARVMDCDVQIYTEDEWYYKIRNHDILALECLNTTPIYEFSHRIFCDKFELNREILRESISTICNNSWVKGKKKLIVSGDYDKRAALKSIFHSIRIYKYGTQVARYGKIVQFDEVNWLWHELKKLGEEFDADILWEKINDKYRSLYNSTASEFKHYAPKNLVVRDRTRALRIILEREGVFTPELLNEIEGIFE